MPILGTRFSAVMCSRGETGRGLVDEMFWMREKRDRKERKYDASQGMLDPYMRLSAAIVLSAVQSVQSVQLKESDDEEILDALFWLALDEMPKTMLQVLEFSVSPLAWLISEAEKLPCHRDTLNREGSHG